MENFIKMKTTYFLTVKEFYKAIADAKKQGLTVDVCTCTCACGETNGSYIYKKEKPTGKLILCESCFNSATKQEKGE